MAFARVLRLALLANGATHAACQTRNLRNGTLSSFAQQEDASCVRDAHCQMTGDSQCKCTYNGGSTFEDPCKCGVCSVDPHCQMSGSVCRCTYNGGSTIEDNCKCGVVPTPTPAPTPAPEPCVVDPHCQMTGDSQCKCTYNGGSTFEDPCKCGVANGVSSEAGIDWAALLEVRGQELVAAGGSLAEGHETCCCYWCSAGGCSTQFVGCSACNPAGCNMTGIPGGCNSGKPVSGLPYISRGFGSVCHV